MRLVCLLAIFPLLIAFNVYAEQTMMAPSSIHKVVIVTAEEAVEKILENPELIIIDSRKKTEFKKGHIEGAINILNTHFHQADLEQMVSDKEREILFYCNGVRCMRSSDAITKAKAWGYKKLFWLRGGWEEWNTKRFPVVVD